MCSNLHTHFRISSDEQRDAVALDLAREGGGRGRPKWKIRRVKLGCHRCNVLVALVEGRNRTVTKHLPVVGSLEVDGIVLDADLAVRVVSLDVIDNIGVESGALANTKIADVDVVEAVLGQMDGPEHQPEDENGNSEKEDERDEQ